MRMEDWFKRFKSNTAEVSADNGVRMLQVTDQQEIELYSLMKDICEYRDGFIIKCVWHQPWINAIKVGDTVITTEGIRDVAERSQLIQEVEQDNGPSWRGDPVKVFKQQVPFTLTATNYLCYNSYLRKLIRDKKFLAACQFDIVPLLEETIPEKERYEYVALPYPPRKYLIGISNLNNNRIHGINADKFFHALLRFLFSHETTIVYEEYAELYGVTAHLDGKYWQVQIRDLVLEKNKVMSVLSAIEDPFFRTLTDWEVENNLRRKKVIGEDK